MNYAIRCSNALKVADGDTELWDLIIQEYSRPHVLSNFVSSPSKKLLVMMFKDESSIIAIPGETYVTEDEESLLECMGMIMEKHHEIAEEIKQTTKK